MQILEYKVLRIVSAKWVGKHAELHARLSTTPYIHMGDESVSPRFSILAPVIGVWLDSRSGRFISCTQ